MNNKNLEAYKRYYFNPETTFDFLEFLKTKAKLIAPHKKGDMSYSYEEVEDIKKVVFKYPRTIQSLKKFFMPPRETLLSFNIQDNTFKPTDIKPEKRIFFGIHSYEMQSIKCLDYSFSMGNPETNYLTRRENALFIGISYNPDEYHFSESLGIEIDNVEGFCLYFYPIENGFIVFEINAHGNKPLSEFGKGIPYTDKDLNLSDKEFKSKIKYHYNRLPQIFTHVYHSKIWDKVSQNCVGCGTCNMLCSTCYCFDVRDEVELNAKDGERNRFWDSCMLNSFAEVAGGEDFRDKLSRRTRHRLYRKFKYITDQSNQIHCVGCGRCSRYCPADINLVEIINDLIDDYSEQQEQNVL